MTQTKREPAATPLVNGHFHKPPTDASARRDINHDLGDLRERAEAIRRAPQDHELAKLQIDILHDQDAVLAILNNFASKDMPGRQQEIQQTVNQILALVSPQR